MPKSIAVISGKGGTGKTTVAVNLATALAQLGENTLLVDGNLSAPHVGFHFSNGIYERTLHDVLSNRIGYAQAVQYDVSGLKIVPGDPMAGARVYDTKQLSAYAKAADYVIFDAPPGDHSHVLEHVDQVIVVTQAQLPALIEAQKAISEARRKNKVLAGVVLNKVEKSDLTPAQIEGFLGMIATSSIKRDFDVPKAVSHQEPFVRLYPGKAFSWEIRELAARLAVREPKHP